MRRARRGDDDITGPLDNHPDHVWVTPHPVETLREVALGIPLESFLHVDAGPRLVAHDPHLDDILGRTPETRPFE